MIERVATHTGTLPATTADRAAAATRYADIRCLTESLAAPLSPEDQGLQSMADASPAKWHRAHTTWFFETFVLTPYVAGYRPFDPAFAYLFNSYYETVGPRHPRPARGMISRPGAAEIGRYRAHVDDAMAAFFVSAADDVYCATADVVALGCHHEQQHQELLLMDILHAFSCNPMAPSYRAPVRTAAVGNATPLQWIVFPGGRHAIGHDGPDFAFDNESPRHDVLLQPFALASRPATNGEWRAFMDDGGYRRADLWLADGWAKAVDEGWEAPLYWRRDGDRWRHFTLDGPADLDMAAPVCHVSHYEADAFARWSEKRLPTEAEWEVAANQAAVDGNFLDSGALRPCPADHSSQLQQMFGDVWEHTQSPYVAYPGFRPPAGAVGEYNGKFMINQMVLRGGACVTPQSHIRATYRNFFYPHMRWQFAGVRLAEDAR